MNKINLNIQDLVRENILNLVPYSSARSEYSEDANVFLDANESPFDSGFNRYPDPLQKELKSTLSTLKNIPVPNIFIGHGSDEAIDLLIRVFCIPRLDEVLIVEPTYGMYSICATINSVDIIRTQLNTDFTLDSSRILDSVTTTTKMIFLCSPNNPTGNSLDSNEIKKILDEFQGIVVIDEAYIDYSSGESWTSKLHEYEKLVVLHTLSKAWGLAGMRLGMAFGHETVIDLMNKIKPPYNISTIVQRHVIDSIKSNKEKVSKWVESTIQERLRVEEELKSISQIGTVFPSDSNFLLIKVVDPHMLYNYLTESGIIVRNRDSLLLCEGCLRITIGLESENSELILSIKKFFAR